jgi:DNA-directed RNA polymerase
MLAIQEGIESAMLAEAKQRQEADTRKTIKREEWTESKTGKIYHHTLTHGFVRVVVDKLTSYEPGKPGSHTRALRALVETGLEPEVIAHLTLKSLLNTVMTRKGNRAKRVTVSIRIGDIIHDELRIRHFASVKERRNLLKKLMMQFDKRSYPRAWRKRTIKNYFHAEQLSWETWSTREKLVIGYALMVWFRDSTGLILADKESHFVDPTEDFTAHIQSMMERRVLDYTLYKPMVVTPKPWSLENLFRGGYLSEAVKKYPLVKRTGRKDAEEMLTRDWSQIVPAVNALQESPFRINKTMLAVLTWAMRERGGGIAGLPQANPTPLPPEPEGYRTDEEVTKAHNLVCFRIHTANREMIAKRQAVLMTMGLAEKFKNFDTVYYGHQLDSRGRAYPVAAFLNPQGPDYVKCLLDFSRTETIVDDEGACWLGIIAANAWGNDKVSLQERADWAVDNEEMLLSIANDPTKDVRWLEAGEPFQFLRACLEWRDFTNTGFGFESRIVCPADATCSGLQHYAGMLRDEIGGRSVNLVPGLDRQDLYRDVADVAVDKLMNAPAKVRPIAGNLLSVGIDRKITKRQVMVVPYAGTFQSCLSYTREALNERFGTGIMPPWDRDAREEDQQHVTLLSQSIWQAIDEVVVKAKEAMKWLTKSARSYVALANAQPGPARAKAMTWVTPDGFLVRHFATELKKQRVDTFLDGRVNLTFYEPTQRLSAQDTATAVAPNFIHSMDACLLRMAVMKALARPRPITSFCMIHDSFGVHAARMGEFLKECVRPAFVEMYEKHDVLEDFRDRMLLMPGLELDPLPSRGTLDLTGVLDSEFFFS